MVVETWNTIFLFTTFDLFWEWLFLRPGNQTFSADGDGQGNWLIGWKKPASGSFAGHNLGGGFTYFLFSPLFGEDSHFLTNIFQRGWNHQLDNICMYLYIYIHHFIFIFVGAEAISDRYDFSCNFMTIVFRFCLETSSLLAQKTGNLGVFFFLMAVFLGWKQLDFFQKWKQLCI